MNLSEDGRLQGMFSGGIAGIVMILMNLAVAMDLALSLAMDVDDY